MRANLARRLWQAMTSPDSGATSGDRARLPGGRDLALDMARLAARHGVSDHLQQDTSSAATRVAILVDRAREQRQTAADADTLAALTRALDVIVLKESKAPLPLIISAATVWGWDLIWTTSNPTC